MDISLYLFKSILSIVVPSAAAPLIPEVDPKTLLTTAVGCDASTSNTRWFPVSTNEKYENKREEKEGENEKE